MIEGIETLPPHLVRVREAFFGWEADGFPNAWEAVYKAAMPAREAEIRRETWKRVLDELEAFSKGEDIEGGVASDVERTYWTILQRHQKKEGFSA